MPPDNKFLSNLEWHALSQGGNIRARLEQLLRELGVVKAERDTLLAENSRLRTELQYVQRVRPVEPAPVQRPATPEPTPVQEEPAKEESLDDAATRFRLLELD